MSAKRELDGADAGAVSEPDLMERNDAYAYPSAPSESQVCVEAIC